MRDTYFPAAVFVGIACFQLPAIANAFGAVGSLLNQKVGPD